MQRDFIITLAWPEGMVAASGAWYDKLLSKNGKYRVGHSAIVLISEETKKVRYFDFGRYHTPIGYGRVRDFETDPHLSLIDAEIQNGKILNLKSILLQLGQMKATHGTGKMYASLLERVSFETAFVKAKEIQKKGLITYGPFVIGGTNCSRFVSTIIQASGPSKIKKLRLRFPFCISPSPKRNVSITNPSYYLVENTTCAHIKKTKLRAYFTSIERL